MNKPRDLSINVRDMDAVKLRAYDGAAIAGIMTVSGILFTMPGAVAGQSGPASWIPAILAHAFALCVFLLVEKLTRGRGGMTEVAAHALGKTAGGLYSVLVCVYFCFVTGILIRESAELIKVYALPQTPVYAIAGIIAFSAAAMNMLGGRPIVKTAGFFFIIVILGIVFTMLAGINRYNPDYLFPLLGGGKAGIANSGLYISSVTCHSLVLNNFASDFESVKARKKAGVAVLIASGLISAMFYLCLVMTFSAASASGMAIGFMELAQSVYYDQFLNRFGPVALFCMIFASLLTASISLFAARISAMSAFFGNRGKHSKAVSCILGGIAFIPAMIPEGLPGLMEIQMGLLWRWGAVFLAGTQTVIAVISAIRRGVKHEG